MVGFAHIVTWRVRRELCEAFSKAEVSFYSTGNGRIRKEGKNQ
jgi:hypothetical protein